jgi:hypothetical protein
MPAEMEMMGLGRRLEEIVAKRVADVKWENRQNAMAYLYSNEDETNWLKSVQNCVKSSMDNNIGS